MLNTIFQFIPANSKLVAELLLEESRSDCIRIFDLEDALLNLQSPEQTSEQKYLGRINILNQFKFFPLEIKNKNVGIRINSYKSSFFISDLDLLRRLRAKVNWTCIVLPKVESSAEMDFYFKTFQESSINFSELIPIVETVKGFENRAELFSKSPTSWFKRAFWGHHDYNLDAGNWPFWEHQSESYWEFTKQLISSLENAGYGFINGAITSLDKDCYLKAIIQLTQSMCNLDFGQATISFGQANKIADLQSIQCGEINLIQNRLITQKQKLELAQSIVLNYEKFQIMDKSFAVNKKQQLFISPQLYLGAKNFLFKHGLA